MNYYNPYFYNIPIPDATKTGLFSRLLGGKNITFSGILTGTQKILNVANQAIPLIKHAKPVLGNAKTMFKVMNEFKRNDKIMNISNDMNTAKNKIENNDGPVFFA